MRLLHTVPNHQMKLLRNHQDISPLKNDCGELWIQLYRYHAETLALSHMKYLYPSMKSTHPWGKHQCCWLYKKGLLQVYHNPIYHELNHQLKECEIQNLVQVWSHQQPFKADLSSWRAECRVGFDLRPIFCRKVRDTSEEVAPVSITILHVWCW